MSEAIKPQPAAAPDWTTETPEESTYVLMMSMPGGDSAQEINLTRAEFIELKRHLAVMRGHIQQELDKALLPADVVTVDAREWLLLRQVSKTLNKLVDGYPSNEL